MIQQIKNLLGAYRRDVSGATLMVFALAIPVVVGSIGVSVDLARGQLVKARLSHALDAAALAGAGSVGMSQSEIENRINKYFQKNFGSIPGAQASALSIEFNGTTLRVTGSADVDTTFMQVLGVSTVNVDSGAVVQEETRGLEVAMVLDVTGSMSTNNNIATLRTAAANFVDIVCPNATCHETVKIGLVPFATTVNVGPYGLGKTPSGATYDTPFVNNPQGLLFKQSGTGSTTAWWGCILERTPPQDTQDSDGTWKWNMYRYVSNAGNTTAPNTNCNKAYIQPLTIEKTILKTRIAGLTPSGNTLSNVGMVWGYRVLSPEAPFREGSAFDDPEIRKVAILMTDGDNNIGNSYSAYGPWNVLRLTDNDLNQKLVTTCQNMKDEGIQIYTITFTSAIDNATKNFFRTCASDPNKYYDAPTQQNLLTAFRTIAAELSNLHIEE